MFEIKAKDNMGRVGVLKTKHGDVKTPALMPVIHPRKQALDVGKYGADIVITNAYLIYKDEDLKKRAIEEGLHKLINFDGPIMTDSGSFQLSVYGDVEITNKEVIEFQELIKTDIGTSLDIPTAPYVDRQKAESDLEITIERAREAVAYKKEQNMEMLLNSVVQGSTFLDLRQKCAKELSALDADLYPIGAVVPLMESYHYKDLVDVVMNSMKELSDTVPRHLMGAGHPMIFALCVAMGCDLFDSAAYILYAEDDRLLSTRGTFKLENLQEMPCSCEVCTKYTPDDLRAMPKEQRRDLIAQHNMHVSFAELRLIRQAIYDGNLMELVEERCRAHPALLEAVRQLGNYSEDLEKYDPRSKKSAFFYTGSESLCRSEVLRHMQKLRKMPKKRDLVILPPTRKPYSKFISGKLGEFYSYGSQQEVDLDNTDFMVLDVPFGLIPLEIDEVYPLSQNDAPKTMDVDAIEFVEDFLYEFVEYYEQVFIHSKVINDLEMGLFNKCDSSDEIRYESDDVKKIKAIADYQFGVGAGEALFTGNIKIEKSKKTGKIRHIYDGKVLIVNMRASDSYLVLSKEGAKRLHNAMPYPQNRVVVNEDSVPFALDGKSVFCKFVVECDENIRAKDEVLIVSEDDKLLAYGKALLGACEIEQFQTGQAIKTRKGFKKVIFMSDNDKVNTGHHIEDKELIKNARKPVGKLGHQILDRMNKSHEAMAQWGVSHFEVNEDSKILDIGCGGGRNIERFAAKISDNGRVVGIDYSEVSVEKSIELNRQAIERGIVNVLQGSVSDMPFYDETFDIVTGFETIYFWPDFINDLKEVNRVLKKGGMVFFCNEAVYREGEMDKYDDLVELLDMKIYSEDVLKESLEKTGFKDFKAYINEENDWICITAIKI